MRFAFTALLVAAVAGCGRPDRPAAETANAATPPSDAQHQGITGPHGDHTPHHGGLVLMQGDVHYEVVLARDGRHQVWFSDAMRNELPASVASAVTMDVARPGESPETVRLAIDDAGEAWIATARPLTGDGIVVTLRYQLKGEPPREIELPFVPAAQ
jgi:hypothetical protein